MVYIGSTKGRVGREPLNVRFTGHKKDSKEATCKFLTMMNELGTDKFSIELIREIIGTREIGRIQEQLEIWKIPIERRLNMVRAFSHNHDLTRDIIKKRQNRKDFYHRHRQDPVWVEKEKIRNRERNRLKRQNPEYRDKVNKRVQERKDQDPEKNELRKARDKLVRQATRERKKQEKEKSKKETPSETERQWAIKIA